MCTNNNLFGISFDNINIGIYCDKKEGDVGGSKERVMEGRLGYRRVRKACELIASL